MQLGILVIGHLWKLFFIGASLMRPNIKLRPFLQANFSKIRLWKSYFPNPRFLSPLPSDPSSITFSLPSNPPSPSINQVCRWRKIGGGNICGEGWTLPLSPLPCSQEAVAMAKWRCGGVGGCGCAITALGRSGSTSGLVGNSFPSSFATTVTPIDKLCWGGFIGNNLGNTGSICCGLRSGGRRQRCSMKVMMVVGRSRRGEVINGVGGWIQMRQGSSKTMKLGEPCMQQEPCLRSTSCLQILGHSSSLLAFENHLIRLQEDLVFALEEDLHAKQLITSSNFKVLARLACTEWLQGEHFSLLLKSGFVGTMPP